VHRQFGIVLFSRRRPRGRDSQAILSANCRHIQMGHMIFNERMPCSSKVSSTTIVVACSVYCSWSMHFISPTTNHLKITNKVCARAPLKNEATCATLNAVVRIRSGSTMQPGTRVSKRISGFGYSFEYPGYPFRALLQ
jgi:hypothetical protein